MEGLLVSLATYPDDRAGWRTGAVTRQIGQRPVSRDGGHRQAELRRERHALHYRHIPTGYIQPSLVKWNSPQRILASEDHVTSEESGATPLKKNALSSGSKR